jgi:hypothetical protein
MTVKIVDLLRQFFSAIMFVVVFVLGSHGVAFPASSARETDSTSTYRVHFQKSLVSIEAKEVPSLRLLEDLSKKSGIVFHARIPLEGTVTASFSNLPLERALQNLFGPDANFMFVYGNTNRKSSSGASPSEVWILGAGQRVAARTIGLDDTEPAADEADDQLQKTMREFERNPKAARDAARRHPDPAVREIAISYLGEQTSEEGITVLLDILGETDPHMRQSALGALGPSVENDPRVRKVMTHVMQTTKDPDVRQFVADALGVPADKDNVGF